MMNYSSNSGAKAMRARREGKASPPTTPTKSDSEDDDYPVETPSRSRRGGIHHSAVKTSPGIGLDEQLSSKVLNRIKNSPRSPSGNVVDDDKPLRGESSYHQDLMVVSHDQLIGDLAKYKKLVEHQAERIFELEGEWNQHEWPVRVLYGSKDGPTLAKVEVICNIADGATGTQYPFSRIADFSSTWFVPSKFVPVIWTIFNKLFSDTDRSDFVTVNCDFIATTLGIRAQFRPFVHKFAVQDKVIAKKWLAKSESVHRQAIDVAALRLTTAYLTIKKRSIRHLMAAGIDACLPEQNLTTSDAWTIINGLQVPMVDDESDIIKYFPRREGSLDDEYDLTSTPLKRRHPGAGESSGDE